MKLRVAVMFGGESVEHEVSIISAHQAIEALNEDKYDVVPVYISKDREFYVGDALKDLSNFADMKTLMPKLTQVTLVKTKQVVSIEPVKKGLFSKSLGTIDVVVPVVHGTNGEDGSLQGYLEMLKVPYTGCNPIAAGVGQDKVFMKAILANAGLPLVDWCWVYAYEMEDHREEVLAKVHNIGYPVILKPACLGSSVGIEVAHDDEEFEMALEECGKYDFKVIIERFVPEFVEINCSVRGSVFGAETSVLEQVAKDKDHDILDFKDKYLGNGKTKGAKKMPVKTSGSKGGMANASRIVPAPISDELTLKIQNLAKEVYRTLSSTGVCRIDFMYVESSEEVYVTEINTIPGSLAFYLWDKVDVDFGSLLDGMIDTALDIDRRKNKMTFSFDSNILSQYKK